MNKHILTLVLAFSTPMLANAATSTSVDDDTNSVLDFMANYETLTNTYDESLLSLYSDQAILRGTYQHSDGSEQPIVLTLDQYASVFESGLKAARAAGEQSDLSDIEVHFEGELARVSAVNYNSLKCVHSDYSAVLQPSGDSWLIVEEFQVIPSQSQCDAPMGDAALVALLVAVAEQTNPMLPAQIDQDTLLMELIADQSTLVYDYKLVTLSSMEMPAEELETLMRPIVIEQSCNMGNIRSILDKGATMRYQYTASDDVWLTEIDVSEQDC
ncbi:hypothetical protein [Saccharospirillum impatiens]|uniref:hypothetical protein n=1 Tax=Saccharospirillum impatiens TaxID=169438 RepID=UPI00042948AE|nr:hypothetical protein [Saccharospirillum impatiens]